MIIRPVQTRQLQAGDSLPILIKKFVHSSDIVIVSSKVIATIEGVVMKLEDQKIIKEIEDTALASHQDPRFTACILKEVERMHGRVLAVRPHVILTELKPSEMKRGRILCPNAGMDLSNTAPGTAVGWPIDPVKSARELKEQLGVQAVIISDSCCMQGRLGVTAFALAVAGIEPHRSEVGSRDLFGKTMRLTSEAIADQLAVMGNAVMGNTNQSTPVAIIREHDIPPSSYAGWVEGVEESEDIFGMDRRKTTDSRQ